MPSYKTIVGDSHYTAGAAPIGGGCTALQLKLISEALSVGYGFLPDGTTPKAIFDPFVFSDITNHVFDGEVVTIDEIDYPLSLNRNVLADIDSIKMTGSYEIQAEKISAAEDLEEWAGIKASYWGKYALLGNNFADYGFSTIDDFQTVMNTDETGQLTALVDGIVDKSLASSVVSGDIITICSELKLTSQTKQLITELF